MKTFNSLYEIPRVVYKSFTNWRNTFNSLYEIPCTSVRWDSRTLEHFQFSLWDSKENVDCVAWKVFAFQFSLWDSSTNRCEDSRSPGGLSILFMRFRGYNIVAKFKWKRWLSILFMRFSICSDNEGKRTADFQFSLWDSLWEHDGWIMDEEVFQFSLWDSEQKQAILYILLLQGFQFSLWDSFARQKWICPECGADFQFSLWDS